MKDVLISEQYRKDLKVVSDFAISVPYQVSMLLPYYVVDCKRNFKVFSENIKYAYVHGIFPSKKN